MQRTNSSASACTHQPPRGCGRLRERTATEPRSRHCATALARTRGYGKEGRNVVDLEHTAIALALGPLAWFHRESAGVKG